MSEPPPREDEDARTATPVRERPDGYFLNDRWMRRDARLIDEQPSVRERLRDVWDARLGEHWQDRRVRIATWAVLGLVLVLVVVAASGSSPAAMPQQEKDFVAAVQRGQQAVKDGNDLTLVTARRDRASTICPQLGDGEVSGWVGTISDLSTVFSGKRAHLTVRLADGIQLRTWERASQDGKDRTLIDPNSDVYRTLAGMKTGDEIQFTGSFRPRGAGCLHETSVFEKNGMLTPSFVFRFTDVAPR